MQQRQPFGVADSRRAGELDGVEHGGAEVPQHVQGLVEDGHGRVARLGAAVPPHAEPGPGQRARVEEGRVVGGPARRGRGHRVLRVRAGQHAEQRRRLGHRPGHRARGVLGRRDRHDPAPADQAQRGLDADHAARAGRAHDRPVGLGADRQRGQPGRHGHAGPGTRPRRVAVQGVRVRGLAAQRAPAAGGPVGAEVGPLGQVRLAEDHRARLTQPGDQEGVTPVAGVAQRGRAGGGGQAADVDVVLDQDGDAVQGARARLLLIPGRGLVDGVRADRDDCPEGGIELGDPLQAPGGLRDGGGRPAGRSWAGRSGAGRSWAGRSGAGRSWAGRSGAGRGGGLGHGGRIAGCR